MFGHTPYNYTGVTQERFLDFKVGDVVNLDSINTQSASGLPSGSLRAQVTNIAPQYKKTGREYKIKAMSYEAAFSEDTEIVLSSPLSEVSLYVLAGAPSQAVTLTFVLDGSYSQGQAAISVGNFTTGSTIILILANGFDGQADGGKGGDNQNNGEDGGTVFTGATDVTVDIYFSGATPSVTYPTADGYIRAPGGGGGGGSDEFSPTLGTLGGGGGGGGAGRIAGAGGISTGSFNGDVGSTGDIIGGGGAGGAGSAPGGSDGGNGGDWGQVGLDSLATNINPARTGGLAGSGVIDNGSTITFHGDTAARYINGNGDH